MAEETEYKDVAAAGAATNEARDAVVDAASIGAGLWFSYLFVLFYNLIAVGGVTHRDLFLESPVRLPFLSVDLPLLVFFWLGPLIFLIVHAYVLLHFVLLAGKVGDFDAQLRVKIADEEMRERLRRQLPSNIFVQFLAGSREVRSGRIGFLLQLIAWISLVIGPVALLVFFELQFLPYHDWAITWWHRIAVLTDIALLWMLWPSVVRGGRASLTWANLRRGKIAVLTFASLVLDGVAPEANFIEPMPTYPSPEYGYSPSQYGDPLRGYNDLPSSYDRQPSHAPPPVAHRAPQTHSHPCYDGDGHFVGGDNEECR